MIYMLTSGEYSDYRVDVVLEGPDNADFVLLYKDFISALELDLEPYPEFQQSWHDDPDGWRKKQEHSTAVHQIRTANDSKIKTAINVLRKQGYCSFMKDDDFYATRHLGPYFFDWLTKERGFAEVTLKEVHVDNWSAEPFSVIGYLTDP